MNKPETFSDMQSDQKEAVALLATGTFLEYFDLMLYVHMAVLLNEIFFPKTDPFTASLLSAFAFCSSVSEVMLLKNIISINGIKKEPANANGLAILEYDGFI